MRPYFSVVLVAAIMKQFVSPIVIGNLKKTWKPVPAPKAVQRAVHVTRLLYSISCPKFRTNVQDRQLRLLKQLQLQYLGKQPIRFGIYLWNFTGNIRKKWSPCVEYPSISNDYYDQYNNDDNYHNHNYYESWKTVNFGAEHRISEHFTIDNHARR